MPPQVYDECKKLNWKDLSLKDKSDEDITAIFKCLSAYLATRETFTNISIPIRIFSVTVKMIVF
jgi:hypothetical protein